jgi:hypothetical protein
MENFKFADFSFFAPTISDWNKLPKTIALSLDIESLNIPLPVIAE